MLPLQPDLFFLGVHVHIDEGGRDREVEEIDGVFVATQACAVGVFDRKREAPSQTHSN